ncbi:hypothetical protein FACS1894161_0810 [Spirochaetia bacterium]|nr:hypothetical protein FACS1894161_0810 [Spirochaetia bacterium]
MRKLCILVLICMFCLFACEQFPETWNDYPALKLPVLPEDDIQPVVHLNRPHVPGGPAPEGEFFPELPDNSFFADDDIADAQSPSDEEEPFLFPEGPKGIHGVPFETEDAPEVAVEPELPDLDDEAEPQIAAEDPAIVPGTKPENAEIADEDTDALPEPPKLAETVFPEPSPQNEVSPFPEITPNISQLELPAPQPPAPPAPAVPPPVVTQAPVPAPQPPAPAAPPARPQPPAQPTPPAPPTRPAAPPAPPVTPPRPASPPVPPPVVRPSAPLPPPEPPGEPPQLAIPDLPARMEPLIDETTETAQFSRMVTAYVGQYVEVPFRGPGWVYLGEQGSRRGVYYDSRRIDSEGMVFVFRADAEGVYSLKFNRQDFIQDTLLNDYVQITVKTAPEFTGSAWNKATAAPERVYAGPRWPPAIAAAVPPRPPAAGKETANAAGVTPPAAAPSQTGRQTQGQGAAVLPQTPSPTAVQSGAVIAAGTGAAQTENAPQKATQITAGATIATSTLPSAYLIKAKEEYDAGRPAAALDILDQFRAVYPGGSDEAYWLYGQTLEANSPARDIRRALDYYRRLVNEYPQSSRYDTARQRIAYLERFYFNIR